MSLIIRHFCFLGVFRGFSGRDDTGTYAGVIPYLENLGGFVKTLPPYPRACVYTCAPTPTCARHGTIKTIGAQSVTYVLGLNRANKPLIFA